MKKALLKVTPPQNLEAGVPHRVTLYAVKTDQDKTLRSAALMFTSASGLKKWRHNPCSYFNRRLWAIGGALYFLWHARRVRSALKIIKGASKK